MNIQTFLTGILTFINKTLIPFLLAIAFLVFVWNGVRYFIIEGANEKEHEKAKSLALWGISAFVIIISLWGIVNMLADGFGFGPNQAITPDYMGSKGQNFNSTSNGSTNVFPSSGTTQTTQDPYIPPDP